MFFIYLTEEDTHVFHSIHSLNRLFANVINSEQLLFYLCKTVALILFVLHNNHQIQQIYLKI